MEILLVGMRLTVVLGCINHNEDREESGVRATEILLDL
jgi:hypothetical protein